MELITIKSVKMCVVCRELDFMKQEQDTCKTCLRALANENDKILSI